jgi:hypothetical protein
MTKTSATPAALATLAQAAGFDLAAYGNKSRFARVLGVPAYFVQDAMRDGTMHRDLASAMTRLAKSLDDGTLSPAGEPTIDPAAARAALETMLDPEDEMTDEELLNDINERFATMSDFVDFAIDGLFKSVLVTGPGGIGKTYPIEQTLRAYQEMNPGASVVCISGAVSAVGLVEALWNTQAPGDVLLIDDADGGFANVDFLNVLKAATDSKGTRVVSWMKQNKKLQEALGEDFDGRFEYHGSVIVISNANMKAKAEKGNGHIDAILSRAMHIDLGINSSRSLALRVNYMINEAEMLSQLFAKHGLIGEDYDEGKAAISAFITENRENFRSLTLREADKIGRMYCAATLKGRDWKRMAKLSLGVA